MATYKAYVSINQNEATDRQTGGAKKQRMKTPSFSDHCVSRPGPALSVSGQSESELAQRALRPLSPGQRSHAAAHLDLRVRLTTSRSHAHSGGPGRKQNIQHHRGNEVELVRHAYERKDQHSWTGSVSSEGESSSETRTGYQRGKMR